MSPQIQHIRDVVDWRLCMGCGACFAACPKGGVRMVDFPGEGLRPVFDEDKCRGCFDCLEVCPGWKMDAHARLDQAPPRNAPEPEFGFALELWEGAATDPELRFQASSGGVLSALSIFCLEQKGFDYVMHTGMDEKEPWRNRTFRSRDRAEVLSRCGSRYSPASPCDLLGAEKGSDSRFVFIGKPCDAAGAHMLGGALGHGPELILTFCCAGSPSTEASLEMLRAEGVDPADVRSLRYRGEGWPGGFEARDAEGKPRCFVPYQKAWSRLNKSVGWRCRLCPHGVGHVADIACGDAWESFNEQSDDPGRSIVMVRTERGRELLREAVAAGRLDLRPVTEKEISAAQIHLLERRKHLPGRLIALRLLRVPTPDFQNFHLMRAWLGLKPLDMARSLFGTLRRIVERKLYRRRPRTTVPDRME